jgi:hypothetical protein
VTEQLKFISKITGDVTQKLNIILDERKNNCVEKYEVREFICADFSVPENTMCYSKLRDPSLEKKMKDISV